MPSALWPAEALETTTFGFSGSQPARGCLHASGASLVPSWLGDCGQASQASFSSILSSSLQLWGCREVSKGDGVYRAPAWATASPDLFLLCWRIWMVPRPVWSPVLLPEPAPSQAGQQQDVGQGTSTASASAHLWILH